VVASWVCTQDSWSGCSTLRQVGFDQTSWLRFTMWMGHEFSLLEKQKMTLADCDKGDKSKRSYASIHLFFWIVFGLLKMVCWSSKAYRGSHCPLDFSIGDVLDVSRHSSRFLALASLLCIWLGNYRSLVFPPMVQTALCCILVLQSIYYICMQRV